MKYIVYLTTNLKSKINGINRIYIGVHKTEDPEIFDGYLGDGVEINSPSTYIYPKTPFLYAVKKYGVKSFRRDVLFIYDTIEEALNKRLELVNDEFINLSHTYNIHLNTSKSIYQFTLSGKLVNFWKNSIDISDLYGYPENKFIDAISNHTEFLGFFWATENDINLNNFIPGRKLYVYLYNKDGKLILGFISKEECSKYLKCSLEVLNNAIKKSIPINRYYVSLKIVDIYIPKPRKLLRKETIYLYNKDGKFIGKYIGKEIFPIIGTFSFNKLSRAFTENNGWYNDYYMSFKEVTKVPKKKSKNIKIDIYTIEGHLIETLNSLKEVREKYHLSSATINKLLKGAKYHDKYIFKYSK